MKMIKGWSITTQNKCFLLWHLVLNNVWGWLCLTAPGSSPLVLYQTRLELTFQLEIVHFSPRPSLRWIIPEFQTRSFSFVIKFETLSKLYTMFHCPMSKRKFAILKRPTRNKKWAWKRNLRNLVWIFTLE